MRKEVIGDCTLYCGDCLEVLPTLEAGSVDAVVTDPPYGISYNPSRSNQQGIQKFEMLSGDDVPFDVAPFLSFPDLIAWCRPQCTVNVPIGMGAWYTWDKVTKNGLKVRIAECEYAWHRKGTKTRAFRHLWSGAYRASESGKKAMHPTQKPVALMEWCLSFVPDAATIFDPFMGSGTTGVACVKTGRKFIGVEIDPHWFDVACRRIEAAHRTEATELFAPVAEPTLFSEAS